MTDKSATPRAFLRQCAPHMRNREWYVLLEKATHTLEEIADVQPQPANTLAWQLVNLAKEVLK